MSLTARLRNLVRTPRPSAGLRREDGRFDSMDARTREVVTASLQRNYFTPAYAAKRGFATVAEYLATEVGRADLNDHLSARLSVFRGDMVPWLAELLPLRSARVLEIGCGTGSSTVALAEQGARVVAMDVDEDSVAVARDRCAAYGVGVEFIVGNASDVQALVPGPFDLVIFVASLEHMTHAERLAAMTGSWGMLKPGGFWGLVDTPNRLWIFDAHTALLPFFLWLPDDLALKYAKFSPRKTIAESYVGDTGTMQMEFLRAGRGLSYHEFHLSFGDPERLQVVGDLAAYLHRRSPLWNLARALARRDRFVRVLASAGPRIHRAFYRPSLDLLIRK
jgi:S-adenosylmethionine-dependent methyltransferase